ncbi:hypothetical protein [Roseateles asaccharophilus]|uniref:Uncharacterized protein n=1 Tax=Roseateles asaccharophilus TaxID=582607 RepID=A0ABU2A4X7_9BURK|nr:hypothetical protein [Roseateles asaccharophilus]MDR7332252.1 hypothetical protein [Roseateles asaccharophilus]
MLRTVTAIFMTSAALLGAGAAQADTRWSIGINLPPVGVVVSDGHRYYEPAPVYYTPAPRYVHRESYYAPPPPRVVYVAPRHGQWHHHHHHDRHDRWESRREHDRHDGRGDRWDDHGPRRGR